MSNKNTQFLCADNKTKHRSQATKDNCFKCKVKAKYGNDSAGSAKAKPANSISFNTNKFNDIVVNEDGPFTTKGFYNHKQIAVLDNAYLPEKVNNAIYSIIDNGGWIDEQNNNLGLPEGYDLEYSYHYQWDYDWSDSFVISNKRTAANPEDVYYIEWSDGGCSCHWFGENLSHDSFNVTREMPFVETGESNDTEIFIHQDYVD